MKNIELRKVPCGETFTTFGEEYVVLDHVDGGVLSIRKGIWKRAPFDRMNNSNLSEANIREDLDDYFQLLKSNGAEDSDLLIQHVDLKATDGTRVYGYLDCTVALLTLEQYGKYKEIIPKVDGAWWLATPVWTRWLRSPYTGGTGRVWGVDSNGNYSNWYAGGSFGVRPVLIFNSCLSVSWQDGEEESEPNEAAQKEELWADYIYYLSEWNEEHTGANNYGSSPMSFAEWLESRCEREDDEE